LAGTDQESDQGSILFQWCGLIQLHGLQNTTEQ